MATVGMAELNSSPFVVPEELLVSKPTLPGPTLPGLRTLWQALTRHAPSTNEILERLSKIDFRGRFDTPSKEIETIRRLTVKCGGDQARRELDALHDLSRDAETDVILSSMLDRSGRCPEDIVRWVHNTTVHVSFEPSVMQDGSTQRPFNPIETLLSGIGQCTGFSILTSALIEAAGYETRLWMVHGHTFLEWRRPAGRWQMEDADLLPSQTILPRGMSIRSLLENYTEWRPVMAALPMHNSIKQIHCYVPTEQNLLISGRQRADRLKTDPTRNLSPGFVRRATRQIVVRSVVRDGTSLLLVDNPNFESVRICISAIPFDVKANPYVDLKGQQDLLKFNAVHRDYEAHFDKSHANIYALIPESSKDVVIPVEPLEARRISVFLKSDGTVGGQPYLLNAAVQTTATTMSPSHTEQSRSEPSAFLAKMEQVFVSVCNDDAVSLAASQYARGLTPKIATDILAKSGVSNLVGRVLDAGCGTGGFALALAEQADSVAAIDYTAERVAFLKAVLDRLDPRPAIEPIIGSIEELPYDDNEFDAIYCRGVIMLTNLPRTLVEFHRVLKPGGQVYIDCNADAWNLYLMLERGRENPDAFRQGRDTLYNTAWRRHSGVAIPLLSRSIAEHGLQMDPLTPVPDLDALLDEMDRHLSAMLPRDAAAVRRLELHARDLCGEERLGVILADMLAVAAGKCSGPSVTVGSQAWRPEEVAEVLGEVGFVNFEWWSEAGSYQAGGRRPLEIGPQLEVRDAASANGKPMTNARSARRHFRGDLTVWHAVFRKPDRSTETT